MEGPIESEGSLEGSIEFEGAPDGSIDDEGALEGPIDVEGDKVWSTLSSFILGAKLLVGLILLLGAPLGPEDGNELGSTLLLGLTLLLGDC